MCFVLIVPGLVKKRNDLFYAIAVANFGSVICAHESWRALVFNCENEFDILVFGSNDKAVEDDISHFIKSIDEDGMGH